MKKIKSLILSAFMVLGIGVVFVPQPAGAINVFNSCGTSATKDSEVCKASGDKANDLIKTLVNVLLFLVGALAVVMLIVGGIFYIISNGDANNIERAKSIITYSIVGLVVAFCAYAIVHWVVRLF